MRCSKVQRRLDDHVDGLLPAPEAEAVRDHLDACPRCRESAEAARAASTSLAAWGDVEPPADCFAKILGRIDTLPPEATRPRPRRWFSVRRGGDVRWLLTTGAAAAAAAGVAVLEWSGGSQVHSRTAPAYASPRSLAPVMPTGLGMARHPLDASRGRPRWPGGPWIRDDELLHRRLPEPPRTEPARTLEQELLDGSPR